MATKKKPDAATPPKGRIAQSLAKLWEARKDLMFTLDFDGNEQCPKCSDMGKLCPAHTWEQYKAHLHEQDIEWAEHVLDPAFIKMKEERQAWYVEDLLYEKDLCEKNTMDVALRNGYPLEEALKQNGKLQWIIRELAGMPEIPEMPTSAKGRTLAKGTRPDLKLVALVHALRYLSHDKGADITESNAQGLAEAAGSSASTSGRELRRHYTRYTMGKDHHAQRLDDGKPYTVKARYLSAIEILEGFTMAKAMAETELEELRERE